jgi:hypothetical protein
METRSRRRRYNPISDFNHEILNVDSSNKGRFKESVKVKFM